MKIRSGILALGAAAGAAVAAKKGKEFYDNQYQMMKGVTRLDENIYLLDYTCDYDLDGMLEFGASNVGEMLAYLSKTTLFGVNAFKHGSGGFACSSFNALNERGEHIYGRNFDYKKAPCMVVWTHPEHGYASVAVADCNFMLYGDYNKPVSRANRLQTLMAPYCCMDGINEKGLAIGILELKTKATKQQTGKKPISTTVAIRAILDKCATVDEAIELLKSYDMHDAFFCCYHYQITDAAGKSAVIEYVNNEMRLIYPEPMANGGHPCQCITNFFLSEDGDNSKGFGQDRYEAMTQALAESGGTLSDSEAMELLEKVQLNYRHEKYPWQVTTLWSAVYNSNALTAQIAAGLDYSKVYEFKVDSPCAAERIE